MVGGRVGRYFRVELTWIWSFFFFFYLLHSYKIRLHINTLFFSFSYTRWKKRRYALPLSVVLQRLRLDVIRGAALCLLHLYAQGLIDGRLLQNNRVLGVGQGAVRDGFFLKGRGGRRPGGTCARPCHQGAANRRGASLSGHASTGQSRKPSGHQRGNLREERNNRLSLEIFYCWSFSWVGKEVCRVFVCLCISWMRPRNIVVCSSIQTCFFVAISYVARFYGKTGETPCECSLTLTHTWVCPA